MHYFEIIMILTFIAAVLVLLSGVFSMGRPDRNRRHGTKLMALRVTICFVLVCEMMVYVIFIK